MLSLSLLSSVQFWPLLSVTLLCIIILLLGPSYRKKWLFFIRRNRWLLLTLFLILSYGLPGEGLGGIDWFPSAQGVREALTQSWRLIAMLGVLACLMTRCSQHDLLLGLHTLLQPLQKIGLPIERSIVRLSLVLAALDTPSPKKEHWQSDLLAVFSEPISDAQTSGQIDIPSLPWRRIDSMLSVLALAVFLLSAFSAT